VFEADETIPIKEEAPLGTSSLERILCDWKAHSAQANTASFGVRKIVPPLLREINLTHGSVLTLIGLEAERQLAVLCMLPQSCGGGRRTRRTDGT
jgi:hypothetical protein